MTDKMIAECDGWAVGTDGIQWILRRRRGTRWQDVSFVRSTKDILRRCMREKGCPPDAASRLLELCSIRFDEQSATCLGEANKSLSDIALALADDLI